VRSTSVPGKKCIMSSSLDDLTPPLSPKGFMDAVLEYLRWPMEPGAETVLKDVTYIEHDGKRDFEVKVLLDGASLDKHGMGRGDGIDRVRRWKRVKVSEDQMCVSWVDFVPEPTFGQWVDKVTGEDGERITVTMLKNPHRIEVVAQTKNGTYLSGEQFKVAFSLFLEERIKEAQEKAQNLVTARVGPSMQEEGAESVIVESLDNFIDYDKFFEFYLSVTRDQVSAVPNAIITEPREGEFFATNMRSRVTHRVAFNSKAGQLSYTKEDGQSNVLGATHLRLHKRPLVLEAWYINGRGERSAAMHLARAVQKEANVSLQRARSMLGALGIQRPCCVSRAGAAA